MASVSRAGLEVVERILTVQAELSASNMPGQVPVAPRSRRVLERAVRTGRLLVADQEGDVAGWVMVEPCAPGTVELGGLYVLPRHRQGDVFRKLTRVALSLHPRAVVVTMDGRFATWLVREHGFARSTLMGVTVASWGMFLWRRAAPWRLYAAASHVRGARHDGREIHYLVRDRPAGEVPLL